MELHREILFKGRSYDSGEWVFGSFIAIHCQILRGKDEYIEVDPKTVCQYTGCLDKNNVKLFEYDIVKGCLFNGSYALGIIRYYDYSFVVVPIGRFMEGISDLKSNLLEKTGNIKEGVRV